MAEARTCNTVKLRDLLSGFFVHGGRWIRGSYHDGHGRRASRANGLLGVPPSPDHVRDVRRDARSPVTRRPGFFVSRIPTSSDE